MPWGGIYAEIFPTLNKLVRLEMLANMKRMYFVQLMVILFAALSGCNINDTKNQLANKKNSISNNQVLSPMVQDVQLSFNNGKFRLKTPLLTPGVMVFDLQVGQWAKAKNEIVIVMESDSTHAIEDYISQQKMGIAHSKLAQQVYSLVFESQTDLYEQYLKLRKTPGVKQVEIQLVYGSGAMKADR